MPAVQLVPPIHGALESRDLLGGILQEGRRSHLRHRLDAGHEHEGLEDRPGGEAGMREQNSWECHIPVPTVGLTWRGQGWR